MYLRGFLWIVAAELLIFIFMVNDGAGKLAKESWALDVRGSYGDLVGAHSDEIDLAEMSATDRVYFLPKASELGRLVSGMQVPFEYHKEIFDCDDFSYWFRDELGKRWMAGGGVAPLAVGVVFAQVRSDAGVFRHAFNAIVVEGSRVVLIEPQGPRLLDSDMEVLKVMSFWI